MVYANAVRQLCVSSARWVRTVAAVSYLSGTIPITEASVRFSFAFVAMWTIFIHDGEFASQGPVVNGAAHHTVHHLYFNHNYGQYTTLWDRIGGSYRTPDEALLRKESKPSGPGHEEKARLNKDL